MSTTQVAEAVTAKAGTSRLRHLGPELRLRALTHYQAYGWGGNRLVYQWWTPNVVNPAPERWFHSPEAALEPWQ